MSWQFLLAISILANSIGTIIQKVILKNKKLDPIAFAILGQLLTACVIGIFAIIHGFKMPNILRFWPNFILLTILYGGANVFIFKSLNAIDASEFTIFFVTRSLWTITAAIVFLGERFSLENAIGTFLVIFSILIISYGHKKISFNRGSVYALIAAAFFGLGFANDAYLTRYFDAPSYAFIDFLLPGIGIALLFPKSSHRAVSIITSITFPKILAFSVIYAVFTVTLLLAYQAGRNAAQIAAISQVSTVIIVLLSIFLLKETTGVKKKIFGAILAFVGVLLLK